MNQLTLELLKFVVMAVAAVAVYVVKKNIVPLIESKMTSEQLKTAQEMAKMFVYMAEQVFGDKSGEERKKIVKDALLDALKKAGINMTDDFVDDMIEAAVKGLKISEETGLLEIGAVDAVPALEGFTEAAAEGSDRHV